MKNRWSVPLLTTALIVALGMGIHYWPDATLLVAHGGDPPNNTPPMTPQQESEAALLRRHFDEGVAMLHTKHYEQAMTAFHWVLQRAPDMPEANVNMGFTLLGLQKPQAAKDFFRVAIELRPSQWNAYYGLAMALETLQDREGAREAMRRFIQVAPAEDRFLPKARAKLQEWDTGS